MRKLLSYLVAVALILSLFTVAYAEASDSISLADKASALLKSLETGDQQAVLDYMSPDTYIQHTTAPDGRENMLGIVERLSADPNSSVNTVRAFTDGDYVFLHTEYNLFGSDLVGFDVFRFEDGLIVEHWDNLSAKTEPNPSGHTQTDGSTTLADLDKTEENKAFIRNFVQDVLMGQNPDKLTSYYDGDNYIQHNSGIADGLSGLGAALEAMAVAGTEMVYDEIHMVLGEGNFVLVMSEGDFAGEHVAFFDLFRVENGFIAEHWDIISTIPTDDSLANGKF